MAFTISAPKAPSWTSRPSLIEITFDNSYATGGEALTPADFGLGEVDAVFFENKGGYVFEYDYANEKVIAYESGTASAALDECDAADDLSGIGAVRVVAYGR